MVKQEFPVAEEAAENSRPTLAVVPVAPSKRAYDPENAIRSSLVEQEEVRPPEGHELRLELAKVTAHLQRMIEVSNERARRSNECLDYAREGRRLAKRLLETYSDEDEAALFAWADRAL